MLQPLVHRQPAPVLLRYRFALGQVDRYSVDVRVKAESTERIMELSSRTIRGVGGATIRVLKVNADHSALLRADVEPLRIAGAKADPTAVTQTLTFKMSPRGEGPSAKLVRG